MITEKKRAYNRRQYLKNVEARKTQAREYRRINAVLIRQKERDERRANPEAARAYEKEIYLRNPQRKLQRSRRWRIKNETAFKARRKEIYRQNPQKTINVNNKRRALKRCAPIGNIAVILEWEKRWRTKVSLECYWCKNKTPIKKCHADHIVPLAKGGPHSIENLCVSCQHCNCTKRTDSLSKWNTRIKEPVLF